MDAILVTGGAGFIGSSFVRRLVESSETRLVVLDKLTYAGHRESLEPVANHPRLHFHRLDIVDGEAVLELLQRYQPAAVVHFAAESHVDRSIREPAPFVMTNVVGTCHLLEAARRYWSALPPDEQSHFRFLHVSTDEVYGSCEGGRFTETSPYAPNSPYAASKAAGDHFARAYGRTYGLPVVITNSSNNFGPYQHPEKLIPRMTLNALAGVELPVYGDGLQVRDWLYVDEHCRALELILERGEPGEGYNVGGNCERTNLEVVRAVCAIVDRLVPRTGSTPRESLIQFVPDRPGHDRRYAIDAAKVARDVGWKCEQHFASALENTVRWYIEHPQWVRRVEESGA